MGLSRRDRRARWAAAHRDAIARPTWAGEATSSPPSIHLHIGELVLHGFSGGARHAIGDAVQRELTRLFGEGGVPAAMRQPGETARIDAGSFRVGAGSGPDRIGGRIATAVYGASRT